MKILYLAHRLPYPPNKGDKLRSFHQIDRLARNHEVWCACFVDSREDLAHVAELERRCVEMAAVPLSGALPLVRGSWGMIRGGTLTESYYCNRRMRAILTEWTGRIEFDSVVAFSSSMAQYALPIQARRRILDLCDRDSQKWRDYAASSRRPMSWAYRTEAVRLARREAKLVGQFDSTLLITEIEARGLGEIAASGKVKIVGNGVTLPTDDAAYRVMESEGQAQSARPVVGFVGAMDYRPNVDAVCWFAEHCWARIRDAFPRAQYRIVGRSPVWSVRRLAKTRGIVVTGAVKDASAEVRNFTVSVAPLRIARGLQNKVLEAMAHGKPVVLTTRAAEGLAAANGRHFVIADEPGAFAGQVCRLLADVDECRRLGTAGRAYVAAHHNWGRELNQFEWIVTGLGWVKESTVVFPAKPHVNSVESQAIELAAGHPVS